MVTLSTRQFAWDKFNRTLIAEDSTLGSNYLGQIYPDAADIGFRVVSMETGIEVAFVLEETRRTDDEVVGWTYTAPRDANKHLTKEQWIKVEGIRASIFND
jgi:hypothetical protein